MENKENNRKAKVEQAIRDKKIIDDSSFSVFQMVEDLKEDVDQKITELRKEIQQDTSVDANVEKVALKLAVKLATLEKGDRGDTPTEDELRSLIEPLIPEPVKGDSYILTDKDKKDIANSIPVPIVEKTIETQTGIPGQDGKTPIKGVDYFTDEDINAISLTALSQHPFTSTDDIKKAVEYDALIKNLKETRDMAAINAVPVTTSFFNGLRAKNLTIAGGVATQSGDTVTVTVSGGGSPSIGGTITGGTDTAVLFVHPNNVIAQDVNNFSFQDNATTPSTLATNTNVALNVNTGGDTTGTDAVNIYAQYDAYLPNSFITNSLTGLNTDGAVPGFTTSSSRGTGPSPSQLQANDMVGGYFGFGAQGASSPTYQNLGGMAVLTTGASANNLGGQLNWYTKADGGSLVNNLSLQNDGSLVQHNIAAFNGIVLYNTSDETTNYERLRIFWSANVLTIRNQKGGTGSNRNLQIGTVSRTFLIDDNGASGAFYNYINSTGSTVNTVAIATTRSNATVATAELQINPTINQSGSAGFTGILINPTLSAQGSGLQLLQDWQVASSSLVSINSVGQIIQHSTASAQGIALYNQTDEVTNFERFRLSYQTNVAEIRSDAGGTGTARLLRLMQGSASSVAVDVNANAASTTGFLSVNRGTSGTNVNHFATTGITTASSGRNAFVTAQNTVNQSSTAAYTAFLANITETGVGSGPNYLIDLQVGSASKFTVNNTGLATNVKGVATAGWGIPAIYGSGRTVGATAAVASVATYTVGAADGSFWVSANVLVTTATTHAFTVTCTYTDEGNTSRTLTLQFSNLAGTLLTSIANAAGTVPYEGVPVQIRCKAATSITIGSAAGGIYTSVVYNIEGNITQIS